MQLAQHPVMHNFQPEGKVNVTQDMFSSWMRDAERFLLPDMGLILPDASYRALPDDTPLRLPFPLIAIEYASSKNAQVPVKHLPEKNLLRAAPTKRVLLVSEGEDAITILQLAWFEITKAWVNSDPFSIPNLGFRALTTDGEPGIEIRSLHQDLTHGHTAHVVLGLLNVLACTNTSCNERVTSARHERAPKHGMLPFDVYRVLTLGYGGGGSGNCTGTGRSPREHLRRGHLRQLPTGKHCWVNSCVINAGLGGKLTKSYRVPVQVGVRS